MSDKEKRHAVLDKFYAQHYGSMEASAVVDGYVMEAMADRIVALEAAIERVRALHDTLPPNRHRWCRDCVQELPCPTLRALEGTP